MVEYFFSRALTQYKLQNTNLREKITAFGPPFVEIVAPKKRNRMLRVSRVR